jgi:hypothetical protein
MISRRESAMLAILLAAGLSSAAPAAWLRPDPLKPITRECRQGVLQYAAEPAKVRLRKLGDLPRAHLMLPVVRTVDGCAAPTVVRYNVEGDGRFAHGSGP